MKMRPIAPSTRHPMRTLLRRAGKAWHFISTHVPGEHFVINSTRGVPALFERAMNTLSACEGELQVEVRDIEGCYPNMPKDIIRQAARDITRQLQDRYAYEGVWVPKRGKRPCAWGVTPCQRTKFIWFPFVELLKMLSFSLDHALIKLPDGTIKRQVSGIPMGDAISPGATICSCAWMEQEFLANISEESKHLFAAGRYMDDVISIYKKSDAWDYQRFDEDLEKQCYIAPLKLEASKVGVFLENEFEIRANKIVYRLKNENRDALHPEVWRYQHFNSYQPFARKRATITAALHKVQFFGSDDEQITVAGVRKLREFIFAGYPKSVLKYCTDRMGAAYDALLWKKILRESFETCPEICG